jgi:hypothetical protein
VTRTVSFRSAKSLAAQAAAVPGRAGGWATQAMITLYKVTARRPAPQVLHRQTDDKINSKDTQNCGVSRKQESGCLPAPDTLTVPAHPGPTDGLQ